MQECCPGLYSSVVCGVLLDEKHKRRIVSVCLEHGKEALVPVETPMVYQHELIISGGLWRREDFVHPFGELENLGRDELQAAELRTGLAR